MLVKSNKQIQEKYTNEADHDRRRGKCGRRGKCEPVMSLFNMLSPTPSSQTCRQSNISREKGKETGREGKCTGIAYHVYSPHLCQYPQLVNEYRVGETKEKKNNGH